MFSPLTSRTRRAKSSSHSNFQPNNAGVNASPYFSKEAVLPRLTRHTSNPLLGPEKRHKHFGHRGSGQQEWSSQECLPEVTNFSSSSSEREELNKKLQTPLSKPRNFWSWTPMKALAQIGQHRVDCLFIMHVHGIEGLPPVTNGLRLAVHWRRKDRAVQTLPCRVYQGSVDFDEVLYLTSCIYVSKHSPHSIKNISKSFTLSVVAVDVDKGVLCKHRLDLSRLLPGQIDGDPQSIHKEWTTSFRISEKMKGGSLIVDIGYEILAGRQGNVNERYAESPGPRTLISYTSSAQVTPCNRTSNGHAPSPALASGFTGFAAIQSLILDEPNCAIEENCHEHSIDSMLKALANAQMEARSRFFCETKVKDAKEDEEGLGPCTPKRSQEVFKDDHSKKCRWPEDESDSKGCGTLELNPGETKKGTIRALNFEGVQAKEHVVIAKQSIEKDSIIIDPAKCSFKENSKLQAESGSHIDKVIANLSQNENTVGNHDTHSIEGPSHVDLDDEADLVAGEFLSMLQQESSEETAETFSTSDSPTSSWLQVDHHENSVTTSESVAEGSEVLFDEARRCLWPCTTPETRCSPMPESDSEDEMDLQLMVQVAESELQHMQATSRGKILADAETEALMQLWGLDEKAFKCSPPRDNRNWFIGPPLPRESGPVVHTRDGGCLRSISFAEVKGNGNLVMQVSRPVVMPAAMGSNVIDILCKMANDGMEKMASGAMSVMPLEELGGKTMEQIAKEGEAALFENHDRKKSLASGNAHAIQHGHRYCTAGIKSWEETSDINEAVALEQLASLAMQKIEALSMEGLKIQADPIEKKAPYTINAVEECNGSEKVRCSFEFSEDAVKAELLSEVKFREGDRCAEDLMSMAISVEEWIKLDAGILDGGMHKNMSALLSAHHVSHKGLVGSKKEDASNSQEPTLACLSPSIGRRGTLTLGMLIQLRDPLSNHEPVGAPMLALVQAERVLLPVSPKLGRTVFLKENSKVDIDAQHKSPKYKITGIHLSGLKTDEENGCAAPQVSSSRWLIAHGMGKGSRHPLLESNYQLSRLKAKQAGSVWSISSKVHSSSNWRGLSTTNSYMRNPDILFPKKAKASFVM